MAFKYKVKIYDLTLNQFIGTRKFTIPDLTDWETQVSLGSTQIGGSTQAGCSTAVRNIEPTIPTFGTCDLVHSPRHNDPNFSTHAAYSYCKTETLNGLLDAHAFSPQTIFNISNMAYYFDDHRNIRFNYVNATAGYYISSIEYRYDSTIVFSKSYSEFYSGAFTIPWLAPKINKLACCYPEFTIQFNTQDQSVSTMWMSGTQITHTMNLNTTQVAWFTGMDPTIIDEDNPYADGGISEESDTHGNFSEDSDSVTLDPLPTIDAVGTGFATLFTPSKQQLKNLSTVMWNGNVFAALQNLVENITGMFTSLAIVPFVVEAGSTVEVTWFGLAVTAIDLTLASKQFYEFDMGSIDMSNDSRIFTSGSSLDYSPFSKLGIFLPFIGFQELNVDECRESIINLKYRIDILSGTCVAIISLNGDSVYQFTGNCLTQIPITNQSMQNLVSDAVQVGIAAAASHSAKGAVASAGEEINEATSVGARNTAQTHLRQAESHLAQTRSALSSATANAAMGIKPDYGKTGAVSASAALLAIKQPYLFLSTPRQCMPEHYQRYGGFPSNITGQLGTFSGLTVVEDIRLNGLVATSDEVAEIYQLLKEGVII